MKKIFISIGYIVALCGSIFAAGNEYFDLKAYKGWSIENNQVKYAWAFYNYATYTVKISDFRIVAYKSSSTTAENFTYESASNQGDVYTESESWVSTVSSSWTATFSYITATACGSACGVSRNANVKLTFSYNGNETVPAGNHYHTVGTNVWISIRHTDWSVINKMDDWSDMEQDTCLGTSVEGTEWKYIGLEYNGGSGSTYTQVCERTNTLGAQDTDTGLIPCTTSACGATPTPTPTPNATKIKRVMWCDDYE